MVACGVGHWPSQGKAGIASHVHHHPLLLCFRERRQKRNPVRQLSCKPRLIPIQNHDAGSSLGPVLATQANESEDQNEIDWRSLDQRTGQSRGEQASVDVICGRVWQLVPRRSRSWMFFGGQIARLDTQRGWPLTRAEPAHGCQQKGMAA